MSPPPPRNRADDRRARLRAWLEYVAAQAIDWLDELDAADADLEPEPEMTGHE